MEGTGRASTSNTNDQETSNKKKRSDSNLEEGETKHQKIGEKQSQSPVDFVVEKQSCEPSDLADLDGGD